MIGISDSSVAIQVSSQFVPSTPAWFGEMALIAHYLKRQGVLAALEEQVHFARRLCWLLGTSVLRKRRVFRTDVPSSQHSGTVLSYGASDIPIIRARSSAETRV